MILTKEQILTLTCLKEVGIKGVGPQKIFAIGAAIDDRGLEIKSYEDLAQLMSSNGTSVAAAAATEVVY